MKESEEQGLSFHVCIALLVATVLQVMALRMSLPEARPADTAPDHAGDAAQMRQIRDVHDPRSSAGLAPSVLTDMSPEHLIIGAAAHPSSRIIPLTTIGW